MGTWVCGTEALLDLDHCGALMLAAAQGQLVVPDLLYHRELADHGGPELVAAGLVIIEASDGEMGLARSIHHSDRGLCLCDSVVVAVAVARGLSIVTDDDLLKLAAHRHGAPCRSAVWVADGLAAASVVSGDALKRMLRRLAARPSCWLTDAEIDDRLARAG